MDVLGPAAEGPRSYQALVVSELGEDRKHLVGDVGDPLEALPAVHLCEGTLEARTGGRSAVARARRRFDCVREDRARRVQTAGLPEGRAEVDENRPPQLRRARGERLGSLEERRRGGSVAPAERAAAGRGEPRGGLRCQPPRCLVVRLELGEETICLLEVVADNLLGRRLALIEPACELLVELCPQRLRYRVVGGVTDEDVAEAEDVLLSGGALGHEQLLADERHQRFGERRLEL